MNDDAIEFELVTRVLPRCLALLLLLCPTRTQTHPAEHVAVRSISSRG